MSGAKFPHVHSSDVAQALTYLVCGDRSEPLEDLRDLRLGRARGRHDDGEDGGPLSLLVRRGELFEVKLEGREQVNGHATTKGEGQLQPALHCRPTS